jgi:hypothetical protein
MGLGGKAPGGKGLMRPPGAGGESNAPLSDSASESESESDSD